MLQGVVAGALLLGLALLLGPRPASLDETPLSPTPCFDRPAQVEAYLARSESRFDDVTPGTGKTVIWADPERRERTPAAVVLLHGFSASRQEVAPLAERVAGRLGANLFATRLTGHGRTPEALGRATLREWLDDTREALAVGRAIGGRVAVVGVSHGATLALWASLGGAAEAPDAQVLISPNLGPRDPRARFLTWPWAGWLVPRLLGRTHSFEPRNELQERYWTTSYPVEALFQVAAAEKLVRRRAKGGVELAIPTLVLYSPDDQVVDPARIRAFFEGSGAVLEPVEGAEDPSRHLLAGDVLSPGTTDAMASRIARFLREAALSAPGSGDDPAAGPLDSLPSRR
ncbi:MAG: alpha/beta fold hydrolase [Thermoanaerobaculia bacterium]|nr:alpha/beta fold hydrolase [Thermoanaerobaculia bacterium]